MSARKSSASTRSMRRRPPCMGSVISSPWRGGSAGGMRRSAVLDVEHGVRLARCHGGPLGEGGELGGSGDQLGVVGDGLALGKGEGVLVAMKALLWDDSDKGETFDTVDIPASHAEAAREWRERLVETAAENDDALMELYLDGTAPTEEQLIAGIRRATIASKVTPVVTGSAFKNKGVQPMLDAITRYLPSPLDVGAIEGHAVGNEEEVITREPDKDAPLATLAFKIASDPHLGKLTYIRIYSGTMTAGSPVLNS